MGVLDIGVCARHNEFDVIDFMLYAGSRGRWWSVGEITESRFSRFLRDNGAVRRVYSRLVRKKVLERRRDGYYRLR